MSRILIKNGQVIDPANQINEVKNLYIDAGKIVAVGEPPKGFSAETTIDAKGKWVCPGLIDISVRLRQPGLEKKATIESELSAAVKGGITSVICQPDTTPIVDTPAVVEWIQQHAQKTHLAKVHIWGALTQGLAGQALSEMHALKQAGCVGLTNALNPITNLTFLKQCYYYAASHDLMVVIRPEVASLVEKGCVHDGKVSTRLGLRGIPDIAETIALNQHLDLIKLTGIKAHFSGLSCGRSIALIESAKQDGLDVSADVAIHQLHLTDQAIEHFNAQAHVRPPLRTDHDKEQLRQGFRSGVIDIVTSDHQPHDFAAKFAPFSSAEAGISGLETLLPLALALHHEAGFSVEQIIASMTAAPAQRLGLESGTLSVGSDADICIIDSEVKWTLDKLSMVSMGTNTPFDGQSLKGLVTETLVKGQLVFQN